MIVVMEASTNFNDLKVRYTPKNGPKKEPNAIYKTDIV